MTPPKTAKNSNGGNLGFEADLFLAADKLRKNLEPSDYKHVVLGLVFLRHISHAFEAKREALLAEDPAAAEDPDEYLAENIFWVPKEARWSYLQANAKQATVGKLIDEAMQAIDSNNASLKGVLPKDYSRPALDKVMLGELIDLISGIQLGESGDRAHDIIGRVYEYFLGSFAGSEGKRGGEFYTPRSVVRVLVEMLEPYKGRVYDPCCGSGGMFVQSERFVEDHGGRRSDIAIYGQESNYTTWRLCKMNLAVRRIDADIKWNNEGSFHKDELKDKRFEKYDIVREMFRPGEAGGFDYRPALLPAATPAQRLGIMAGAVEWVLAMQQQDAAKETTDDAKKRAHRRFDDAVLSLSKALALASASDEAREIRDAIGFFQAIRTALVKSRAYNGRSPADRELAIQQIISRAVVSTDIIDIMKAAGVDSPDISILSDQFLAEVHAMEKKNLALEAMRKLINGEVHSQGKRNVVQARAFSERLEDAISRYHNNAITTVQVLEELIQLAKDIRAAREMGAESGLSPDEIAFYDALADNKSAREAMGIPALRVIAHELVTSIKTNLTVDWMHRDAARARMRVLVKRILRKYGYPPDLQDAAVLTVLQQAEALSAEWAPTA